jgi:hypothetical protein
MLLGRNVGHRGRHERLLDDDLGVCERRKQKGEAGNDDDGCKLTECHKTPPGYSNMQMQELCPEKHTLWSMRACF